MGIELNPKGGELAPPDTGAAGADNDNADGAAGKNGRKSPVKVEGGNKTAKKTAKKA